MSKTKTTKIMPLQKEVSRGIFIFLLVLLIVTVAMGFRFYVFSSMKTYNNDLEQLASFALSLMDKDYVEELFRETKEIYDTLPEDVKLQPFTDEYREYFRPLTDDRYKQHRKILVGCRESTNISNIYMGFYDKENTRLVLVLDGDIPNYYYIPGQYIANDANNLESWEKIEKIMNSSWYMSIMRSDLVGINATDYMPLNDKNGDLIGVIAIDTNVQEFYDELLLFAGLFLPTILLLFIFLSTFMSKFIEYRVIRPVNALAKAAREYTARDKVNETDEPSVFANVKVSSAEEFIGLRDTMAIMENDINKSMQEVRRVTADKERMAAELDIAAQIQRSAIPSDFPKVGDYDIYAVMHSAKEVAGDFYDFYMIDEDHLVMVIADVSGKGVPAALFMMKSKEILKNNIIKNIKPSEILKFTNEELAKENENMMFVTVWLGILEISTGILTAANAGHEYPCIAEADGTFRIVKDTHGALCGAVEGMEYDDYTVSIQEGGGLFLYTDGVAEATNGREEAFGLSRIEECLNKNKGASAKELIEAMKTDVDVFTNGMEQFDDITMFCILKK